MGFKSLSGGHYLIIRLVPVASAYSLRWAETLRAYTSSFVRETEPLTIVTVFVSGLYTLMVEVSNN